MAAHRSAAPRLADFVVRAEPPAAARARAATAVLDTVGVTLAGASEPAARLVREVVGLHAGPCCVIGTARTAGPAAAAWINGTAAHALDYDDMCFVSLAHPSAPLVPAILAIAEARQSSGRAMLDAYVVAFEVEARLGRAMNPDHYRRGWHSTSTIGVIGAAAAVSRLLGLDAETTGHALAIAASSAAGLKENFGTMVKPLHAGAAAHGGVVAALLAQAGLTASDSAIDGPQGYLHAMDGEHADLEDGLVDLGERWEIVDTGITVKLYPSCAGTHPSIDAILDLRRAGDWSSEAIERVEIGVDAVTPTVLIHARPATGLEAKFSMPWCAAAALVNGRVGLETFEDTALVDPRLRAMAERVTMHVDASLDPSAPALTQARIRIVLRDGRTVTADAHGARGYPNRPASDGELSAKFLSCARRAMNDDQAARVLAALRDLETDAGRLFYDLRKS